MKITVEQLLAIMPAAGDKAALYEPFLNQGMQEFGITSDNCVAAFLANLSHETGDLQRVSENLNYSADGLANTWPSRYAQPDGKGGYLKVDVKGKPRNKPNDLAVRLAKAGPEAIANNCYANRMGNGDEASGDGWRCRGAGGFQITGLTNMARIGKFFNLPVASVGDWLRTPEGSMRSAAWFFWQAGCEKYAEGMNFDAVCDLINIGHHTEAVGDAIGYADRNLRVKKALEVLKNAEA